MRGTLLFLAVCLVLYSTTVSGACVRVRAGQTAYFLAQPQSPPNPALTNCPRYTSSSCCTAAYTNNVTVQTDPIHSKLLTNFLSNLNPECTQLFDDLACLYCSPDTASFVDAVNSRSKDTVHICESFCNRMYDECADATVVASGKKLSEEFATGKEFCSADAWLEPFVTLVQAGDSSCFDPASRLCTSNDYQGKYTACVNNRRDYVFTWKYDEHGNLPCSGGVTLPATKYSLPCDIACKPGQYLPGGELRCASCLPGTFSIGGGESISYWSNDTAWPSLPEGTLTFSTYCQNKKTGEAGVCAGWERHGAYITSGENKKSHGIESILELDVVLVEDGRVTFIAEVDSEPGFDGLRFEIAPNQAVPIPITGELNTYSYTLTKGAHLLRWVYYKDDLWSAGSDMAIITKIEIDGIRYADEKCTSCPPGTFQRSSGQTVCDLCSFGTIPLANASDCRPCDPLFEYAFPGDSQCKIRPDCTENDYEVSYSDCRAPGVRDQSYEWITPQWCHDTGAIKPASSVVPCEPCNPGEYRAGNWKCRYCPEGLSSDGGINVTKCESCPAGTAAVKRQTWKTWNRMFPASWGTDCDRCSSGGWRAHYNSIDSGEGDGLFGSWLQINNTWYTAGSVNITANFECPNADCSLTLWLDDDLYFHTFSTGNSAEMLVWGLPVPPGNHSVYLDFARWVPWLQEHSHTDTRVIVHSVVFVGTTVGGAAECSTCPDGHATLAGDTTRCVPCPAGKVVDPVTHRCINCPENTITDQPGMKTCLPCGPGTSTNGQRGATECDNNGCTFSYTNGAWPVNFNFSSLMRLDSMWGPVFDPVYKQSYWINICTMDHVNNTCQNKDGTPMATFVCQITPQGSSKDLGRIMGFVYYPPTDMSEEKVVITYRHGTPCMLGLDPVEERLPVSRSSQEYKKMMTAMATERSNWQARDSMAVERSTNVTLICDPTAGLGYPQAPPDGIEDQREKCLYDFVWYSLYGCHICTENDYDYYYTPCERGLHTKVYFWKYSPRRCWGGVTTLPADVTASCSPSTQLCGDGQYVSPKYSNCTACPAGNYSIGGGVRTQWWSTSLTGFVIYCESDSGNIDTNCKGGWMPNGDSIRAQGNTRSSSAVLSAERNFIREGTVSFEYSLLTDNGEPLSFYMDDKLIKTWNHTSVLGKDIFTLAKVPKGTHVFKWKYSPFVNDEKPRVALIWSVTFNGTTYSEASCSPCQGSMVQEDEGSSSCHTCPAGSVYNDSPYKCQTCPPGTYALPGSEQCTQPPLCTRDDYYELFAACKGGKRNTYWKPYEPVLCQGGVTLPNGQSGLSCECPRGYYLVNDECQSCPAGKHHNGIACVAPETGATIVKVREFLSTAQGTDVRPFTTRAETGDYKFTTGCAGECGSPGWRFLGSAMDSGVHTGTAYSWVYFNATLEVDGEISFNVDLSTHHMVGPNVALEFYVDQEAQTLVRQASPVPIKYKVSKGAHRFLWVHYQEKAGDTASQQQSKVWDVRVEGTRDGGNVQKICDAGYSTDGTGPCSPCTPGYASALPKQNQCLPCEPGTFTSDHASTSCTSCGYGTYPNKKIAATACSTSCIFDVNATLPDGGANEIPYRFDLDPFRKVGVINVPSHNDWPSKYSLQVCDKMTPNQASNPCKEATFVCEQNDALHRNFNAGSLLSFIANTASDDVKPYQGFKLEYSLGADASCSGKQRKSVLHFSCKLGATPYTIFTLDLKDKETEARACEYHFLVETEYACPLCDATRDVKAINGECLDGMREIKYETLIPCINPPKNKQETCSNIEVNEFAILVIAGTVALMVAALIGLAIYFWNKKRQMAQKYELLVAETSAPLEMQEVNNAREE